MKVQLHRTWNPSKAVATVNGDQYFIQVEARRGVVPDYAAEIIGEAIEQINVLEGRWKTSKIPARLRPRKLFIDDKHGGGGLDVDLLLPGKNDYDGRPIKLSTEVIREALQHASSHGVAVEVRAVHNCPFSSDGFFLDGAEFYEEKP